MDVGDVIGNGKDDPKGMIIQNDVQMKQRQDGSMEVTVGAEGKVLQRRY